MRKQAGRVSQGGNTVSRSGASGSEPVKSDSLPSYLPRYLSSICSSRPLSGRGSLKVSSGPAPAGKESSICIFKIQTTCAKAGQRYPMAGPGCADRDKHLPSPCLSSGASPPPGRWYRQTPRGRAHMARRPMVLAASPPPPPSGTATLPSTAPPEPGPREHPREAQSSEV